MSVNYENAINDSKGKKRFSNFENEAFSSVSHESSAGSGLRARGRREPDDRRPEDGLAEGLERRRVHVEQDRGEGAALPGEHGRPHLPISVSRSSGRC